MLNTQGSFSYTELMAMELGEYLTLIEEIGIVNELSAEEPKTAELTLQQQMEMAEHDPALRKA